MLAAGSISVMVAAQGPETVAAAPAHLAPILLSGRVTRIAGTYVLTDENTKNTFELRGADLKRFVDQNVKIQGNVLEHDIAVPGALHVVEISRIMPGNVSGSAMSGRTAAAGVKTGMSTAAKAGVLAGTAATSAVGALYISGAITGNDKPASQP